MKRKTIFPNLGEEKVVSIDISKYMEKIISKNYDLLKELGRK